MKRRDVLISTAIIAVALLVCYVVSRQTGFVTIEPEGAQLRLRRSYVGGATIRGGEEPRKVSARAYTPQSLRIERRDNRDVWKVSCIGPWGDLAKVRVRANETTSLKVGPPLRIVPVVSAGGGRVHVQLRILGCAGEQYSNIIAKNNRSLSAPGLKILDREGDVLASGRFSYG